MPSELLHARADAVVAVLSGIGAVRGVLCFGSYAMGTFDDQSDIDLYVLCHPDIVTPENRRLALGVIDGVTELQIGHQDPIWDDQWIRAEDRFRLHGVLIDVGWNTIDWLKTVIRRVSEETSTSFPELRSRAHTVLGLLADSVILLDAEGSLRRMQSELYPYPTCLKQALLRASLPILRDSLGEMSNYAARAIGNTALHFHLERFLEALRTIVFALNERYDPCSKRVEQVYATMDKLPPDFVTRYKRALEIPLSEKGRRELVNELGTLTKDFEMMIETEASEMNGDLSA
jgi:hypothetical protein